jgi:uncharacterized coiled-coil protein SlyX
MKKESVGDISRELDRIRTKRDALTAGVTTLDARIVELETRLSEQEARRAREQVEREIEEIIARLQDAATRFGPAFAALCNLADIATAVIPEARALHDFLKAADTEIGTSLDLVLRELHRRREAVRAGLLGAAELPQLKVALERLNAPGEPNQRAVPPGSTPERSSARFGLSWISGPAGWWNSRQNGVESRV